ncbi:MAG: radical SAM protein [Lachnospiraceae bacterium]|nr:radical SAM protein [Lachnospiraceae bacterium]
MLFNIWVTQDCNLSCKYCYEKAKRKRSLSPEDADAVIAFVLKYQTNRLNQVNFHGGEPLLNWNVIKYIVQQINCSSLKKGQFRFSFTTNGIIITDDVLHFLKENEIRISVSIDGKPQTHNKNRIDQSGNGTYPLVEESLRQMEEKGVDYEIRMTYTSETISELAHNVAFLLEHFKCSCLRWAPDCHDCGWNEKKVQILIKQYQSIMEYQEKIKKEQAEKIAAFNINYFNRLSACCGGVTEINIDTRGDLYPCTYVCGNKEFLMGNVKDGPDVERIKSIHNTMQKSYLKCETCQNKEYCIGNRCKMINYVEDNRCSSYIENLCSISNAEIDLLREQWML